MMNLTNEITLSSPHSISRLKSLTKGDPLNQPRTSLSLRACLLGEQKSHPQAKPQAMSDSVKQLISVCANRKEYSHLVDERNAELVKRPQQKVSTLKQKALNRELKDRACLVLGP